MKDHSDFPFQFIRRNPRSEKPRSSGITEIRGPYYTAMGKRCLKDILETMGAYVDSLKFAGGAFALMSKNALEDIIGTAHDHDVLVSTGGFVEYVLMQGNRAVENYIDQCKDSGFDIVEISSGFITLPTDDWLRLIEYVQNKGLKAKPEIGLQFGAGGASSGEVLKQAGIKDIGYVINQAKRFIEAGVYMIMVESEGITENTTPWRTDIPARLIDEIGMGKLMFEAADPAVFEWYIKSYGYNINLFVDHSQIIQVECLRSGIWGTKETWGRIAGFE